MVDEARAREYAEIAMRSAAGCVNCVEQKPECGVGLSAMLRAKSDQDDAPERHTRNENGVAARDDTLAFEPAARLWHASKDRGLLCV